MTTVDMASGEGGEKVGGEELSENDNTSDTAYAYACTLCIQKKGSYSEATSYCPECDVFYCKPCLQYICDHGCLGKANMDRWGKPTCTRTGQPCREHPGNLIQLYCGDNNDVGCHVCVAEYHHRCSQLMYIPTMVSKQETRQHLEAVQREIEEMKSKLIDAKRDRVEKKKHLQNTYNSLKGEIQEFRRKMSELLEELEKQSIDELNELERTINDQLDVGSQAHDSVQEEIDSIQDKLQKSDIDDIDMFIWWKQSNTVLKEANKIVLEAKPTSGTELMLMYFHAEIECLKSLKSLGKLRANNQINRPYTVQSKSSLSIRHGVDTKTCLIISMCQLSDGTFVISDHNNACLKQLNKSNAIISRLSLSSYPYMVCSTGKDEVAVALSSNKVQFVSVGESMKTTSVINLNHRCAGLACRNNKLYVTDFGSTVYVYSTTGSLVHEYTFGEHLSCSVFTLALQRRCIGISPDNIDPLVYVTNPHKNILLTIDTNGKVVSSMSPDKTKCLSEVCVDDVGNVFVCGVDSNDILQVDATGIQKVGDIIQQSDGIKNPNAICFDRVNTRLLVVCKYSDIVHLLDLAQL